jgi:hypothetical protein
MKAEGYKLGIEGEDYEDEEDNNNNDDNHRRHSF